VYGYLFDSQHYTCLFMVGRYEQKCDDSRNHKLVHIIVTLYMGSNEIKKRIGESLYQLPLGISIPEAF